MHTHIHTYKQTHTHRHTYIHPYIHTYTHTHIQTHTQTYIHTYTHTHIQTHTDIHTYIHTEIQTYRHTDIQAYIHTYMHIYIISIHLKIACRCKYTIEYIYIDLCTHMPNMFIYIHYIKFHVLTSGPYIIYLTSSIVHDAFILCISYFIWYKKNIIC